MRRESQRCRRCREAVVTAADPAVPDSSGMGTALRAHLAECASCRDYAASFGLLAAELRGLPQANAEPGPHLRRRWVTVVRAEAGRPSLAGATAEWLERLRLALAHNLKPIAALAPIWLLIVFFRLAASGVDAPPAGPGQSPTAIVRLLKAEQRQLRMLASGSAPADRDRNAPAQGPRSQFVQPAVRLARHRGVLDHPGLRHTGKPFTGIISV